MNFPKIPRHGKTKIGSIYINLGSDGDQWIISPTKDGGIVITHVPPREPVTGTLTNVVSVIVKAEGLSAEQINAHFKVSGKNGEEVLAGIAMLGAE